MAICNYIGGDKDRLDTQAAELEAAGVAISPNPDDQDYCWYEYGGRFIMPVGFNEPYFKLSALFYPESSYLHFNTGTAPEDEMPDQFKQYELIPSKEPFEVVRFMVIEEIPPISIGERDHIIGIEHGLINYILEDKEKWPKADIIDSDIRLVDGAYTVYIAGYDLPRPENDIANGVSTRPPFDTAHCPEWTLHQTNVEGEISLDGWSFILRASPAKRGESRSITYLAIPRNNSKEKLQDDLRTKLEKSEFLKGDDPIRTIKTIRSKGNGGVAGLDCPLFEVDVLEIQKTEDNCLAWVEAKAGRTSPRRAEKLDDGYLINLGDGRYKYISATKGANISQAASIVFKRAPEQAGLDKIVSYKNIVNDPVCSAYEIGVNYVPSPPQREPAEPATGDLLRLQQKYYHKSGIARKIRALGELGEVIWARPPEKGSVSPTDLVKVIKNEFHEDAPVNRYEMCLVVDQSGSMSDNADNVSKNFDQLEAELAASSIDASISLVRFTDEEFETLVRLSVGRNLSENSDDVRRGLADIAKNTHGGLEYIYEAADKALDEFEMNGIEGSRRKILLLTDEEGDMKDNGQTAASIKERASFLGVEFKIIFIADSGGSWGGGLKDYLGYLEVNGIDITKMTELQRIGLWKEMLDSDKVRTQARDEALRRLSDASVTNRNAAAKAIENFMETTGDDSYFRLLIIEALGNLGGDRAEEILGNIQRYFKETTFSRWMITSHAIKALGKIGTPSALKKAKEMAIKNIYDWHLDNVAVVSIARSFDEDDIEELEKKFNEGWLYQDLRIGIIKAIGENGSPAAIKALKNIYAGIKTSTGHQSVREALLAEASFEILRYEYDPDIFSVFIENRFRITSDVGRNRDDVILSTIFRHRKRLDNAVLENIMNTSFDDECFLAALILADRGHTGAIGFLNRIIDGKKAKDGIERDALAEVIGEYYNKEPSAIKWIERLLMCGDSHLHHVAEALKLFDDTSEVKRLLASPILRQYIEGWAYYTGLIAKADKEEAIRRLTELCHDLDPSERKTAAETLGEIGGESVIPVLSELLADPDAGVVQAAGDAIEKIQKKPPL